MRKQRYHRRQSRSAIWAMRIGLFSFLLLVLGFLPYRFWKLEWPDFVLVAVASGILAVLALILAGLGLRALWVNGDKGGARSFWGSLAAIAVRAPLCTVGAFWLGSPPLHDVSTDLQSPPQFPAAMPARSPRMNPVTARPEGDPLQQLAAYPDVVGRRYAASPDRVGNGVVAVLKGFGWTAQVTDAPTDEPDATIYVASARSFYLGLESDIVIRLRDEGDSTFVDVRSLSRYGKRDMGENAAFITRFLASLEGEVNKAPANAD